jgi:hypothetical protein
VGIEAKFKVGDWVWHATFDSHEKWVKCPDCLGFKTAKLTFGDGTDVTVECGNCAQGFDPPRGIVCDYEYEPRADQVVVEGIDIHRGCCEGESEFVVRYSLSDHRVGDEMNVFDNKQDAKKRAEILAQDWAKQEQVRLNIKDKPSKNWAQNASYHRQCVKRAQRDLEYHTQKLNVAKSHAKETEIDA